MVASVGSSASASMPPAPPAPPGPPVAPTPPVGGTPPVFPSPTSPAPGAPSNSAFTAIGAPPVPEARDRGSVLGTPAAPSAPNAAPRAAGSPLLLSPASTPTVEIEEKKRRRWPWLLLALATIAASGALSWFVASSVEGEQVSVAQPTESAAEVFPEEEAEVEVASPDPQPADSVASIDPDLLADEPFARAAEIIRPSVVQLQLANGLGTGVITNSNGTILTAAHVVGDAQTVTVTFFDGSSVEGEVVGADVFTDVAVVRVDPAGRELTAARLADGNDVRVGQSAVAVGSPFGFDQTVTAGIISAIDRVVNGVSMVQTDAPINPGNSGGPLINLEGEVVGINDLIFTESGSSAGVGFAISIDLAVIIADQLIMGVEPQLALLGVGTGPPPNGQAGALINEVNPGTAAAAAGLEVGDIVTGVDGSTIRGSNDLRAQIIDLPPGSDVTISIIRDGERVELPATLGQTGN